MKTIRVAYVGWWDSFDMSKNMMHNILKNHYNVVLCSSEEADYSICSLYGNEFVKAKGVRIFYSGEAGVPDFNLFDYAIGFDKMDFGDRYVRVPNYLMNYKYHDSLRMLQERHLYRKEKRELFCSWVCSNGSGDKKRDEIFDALSAYRRVDSAGTHRNNISIQGRLDNKLEFEKKYKFSLALENTSYKGYTTEKLVEAFAAGGIPIYWGDPDVDEIFNKKAFINLMDFPSLEEGIEFIKKVDEDDDLYESIRSQKVLVNDDCFIKQENELERFLLNIFDQNLDEAYRRPHGQTAKWVEDIACRGLAAPIEDRSKFGRLKKILKKECGS